jgi:hypothetical protein
MRSVLAAVSIGALGVFVACHGSSEPRVASAIAGLPEYTPEEAAVFDDVLAPPVFGLRAEVAPEKDPNLAARVGHADWVGRARVSTVSREALAGKDGYTLGLSPEGAALAGSETATSVELRVPQGSPSYLRLETASSSLVGKRIILFVRKYADRGEPTSHWHGEADEDATTSAIAHQKALDAPGAAAHTKD